MQFVWTLNKYHIEASRINLLSLEYFGLLTLLELIRLAICYDKAETGCTSILG